MKKDNYKNLLEAIKDRKSLIMDLGDDVLLHMKWNEEKELYEDELGYTTMKLINDILNNKVRIRNHLVEIREDL